MSTWNEKEKVALRNVSEIQNGSRVPKFKSEFGENLFDNFEQLWNLEITDLSDYGPIPKCLKLSNKFS